MNPDQQKAKEWCAIFEDYEAGELSIRKFCAAHNLKEHQFKYWRTKLKKDSEPPKLQTFIEVKPIKQASEQLMESITIEVNRVKIDIPPDFNPVHLRKVLKVVKSLD